METHKTMKITRECHKALEKQGLKSETFSKVILRIIDENKILLKERDMLLEEVNKRG